MAHERVVLAVDESVHGRDLDVLAGGHGTAAHGAEDAVGMIEHVVPELDRLVAEVKGQLAAAAPRSVQPVEVSLAVEETVVGCVAFGLEVVSALDTAEAALVEGSAGCVGPLHVEEVVVSDVVMTLGTVGNHHVAHCVVFLVFYKLSV